MIKLDPSIFEKAAELILNKKEGFCCIAIDSAYFKANRSFKESDLYIDYLADWFKPDDVSIYSVWWNDKNFSLPIEKYREARVLALCFAAHLLELDKQKIAPKYVLWHKKNRTYLKEVLTPTKISCSRKHENAMVFYSLHQVQDFHAMMKEPNAWVIKNHIDNAIR